MSSQLATYKDVAILFLKYGSKLGDSTSRLSGHFEVDSQVEACDDGENFARDLERLGPTFVKIGQLLSTRADIIPPDWISALRRLQDDVEAVPIDDIREVVENELGVKISNLFEEFDETPLASASLGQVHRAVLRDSKTEVAVKIQRPGIRKRILDELDAIERVTSFLEEHTDAGGKYEIGRMTVQMRRSIIRELNYHEEAANLDRLRRNLAEAHQIIVPRTYPDYCSDKVLTMDYVQGTNVTDLSGVVRAEIDGGALAETLFSVYLKQVLIDGFFHADPHPGNILITRDRRLVLLDLGMVGAVPDTLKDKLTELLTAIADGRSAEASSAAQSIGSPRENYDPERCTEEITRIVEDRKNVRVKDLQVGSLVMEVTQICGQNGLRIPDAMFMLGKMLLNLDMIGKVLDPDFDPDASLRRHTGAIARHRIRDQFSIGGMLSFLTEVKEMLAETPGRFNSFVKDLAQNQVEFKVNAIDETKLLKGFHRVANRITVGLILSALIIGAAMMMNIESKFTLFGYPGLAIIFFLAAALGGLILVFNILIKDGKDT